LKANKGRIRFKWTPRHNADMNEGFGQNDPRLFSFLSDANNYLYLQLRTANSIRLGVNSSGAGGQTGDWDCTGAIVSGTTYLMDITYTSSKTVLKVDGVVRITITTPMNFASFPATAYYGMYINQYQADSVISPP